jgi:hypothetical protein
MISNDGSVERPTSVGTDVTELVEALQRVLTCRRCKLDPPPPARWPGDVLARDNRPPHTCGLSPYAR